MQNNQKRIATRLDITVCVALAVLYLVIFGFWVTGTPVLPLLAMLTVSFAYAISLFIWALIRMRTESVSSTRRLHEVFGGDMEIALTDLRQPALLCDENGKILWCNRMLVRMTGRRDLIVGVGIDDICRLPTEELVKTDNEGAVVSIGDRLYRYEGIRLERDEGPLFYTVFTDCTDLETLRRVHAAENTAVAYIIIDNIEEVLQYVQDSYRSAATAAEDAIKKWVNGMNGVLKSYEKDKYIAFFNAKNLAACAEDRFSVLDSVRSVRVGDGMPITISIGVSAYGTTLAEKEAAAQAALDMALQRGGDQAVLRSENGDRYFGGKTKAIQKRNNVRSRVVANELRTLFARTDSVIIMGHRFGDFDSFGSTVGIARLAMIAGIHPHIIVNREDPNLAPCFEKLAGLSEYDDVFVDGTEGMDLVRPDTLLVVCDVNNIQHVEYPDIVESVDQLVIIDHHRKTTEFTKEPITAYIEPSASSASELVAEILEQQMMTNALRKEEAELMLAGILLDTKQFSRNTGTRTFAAALFLRGEGAVPGESTDLFRADVDDLTKEARFHTNVRIYRDKVALAHIDGDTDPSYRVIAAKAADKLLSVKGVAASFTLVLIGNKIHISARSDGSINVQLILERLNGGGHFDVAGAQVEGESMETVIARLRESIDKFLDR